MKKIACLAFVLPALLVLSCSKPEDGKKESGIPQLSIQVKDAQAIYEVPENQTVSIQLAVTADPTSAEAYTITLGANPALVSSYNSKNGTSFQMLPSDAYAFVATTVMLTRYSPKSTSCEIRLKGMGCDPDQTYLLPVVVDQVQGGTNFQAPDDKAAYIQFKMIASQAEGEGTQSKPFLLKTTDDFLKMNSYLRDNETVYFKMAADVDFKDVTFTEEKPWTPAEATEGKKAVFDGDGHKISNFKADAGLFSILEGSVMNLTIEDSAVECGTKNKGGLIAGTAGTETSANEVLVKNVNVKNSSISNDYSRTGAVIGYVKGGIIEDVNVVDCSVSGEQQVGGVVGRVENGALINCVSTGSAHASLYFMGGVVGFVLNSTVKNCHSSAKMVSEPATGNYSRAGGLIGEIRGGLVENCYATGDVDATLHFAGGLIGSVWPEKDINISKCYATGNVTYTASGNKAGYGGLIGRMELGEITTFGEVTISNCYATGDIKAFRWSSGFVGDVEKGKLTIENCYSSSDISKIGPDGNGNYECGIVVGKVRTPAETTIKCTGFVAWNVSNGAFCFPADAVSVTGNYYGTEGTASSQATALGWSTDIWNLSGNFPVLK